jgi:hypothetical protein
MQQLEPSFASTMPTEVGQSLQELDCDRNLLRHLRLATTKPIPTLQISVAKKARTVRVSARTVRQR